MINTGLFTCFSFLHLDLQYFWAGYEWPNGLTYSNMPHNEAKFHQIIDHLCTCKASQHVLRYLIRLEMEMWLGYPRSGTTFEPYCAKNGDEHWPIKTNINKRTLCMVGIRGSLCDSCMRNAHFPIVSPEANHSNVEVRIPTPSVFFTGFFPRSAHCEKFPLAKRENGRRAIFDSRFLRWARLYTVSPDTSPQTNSSGVEEEGTLLIWHSFSLFFCSFCLCIFMPL